MDLIAQRAFRYRGRALVAGQPFSATRSHGRLLVALGRATVGTYEAPQPQPKSRARPAAAPAPDAPVDTRSTPDQHGVNDKIDSSSRPHPLDHDRDGRPGGSIAPAPADMMRALREEYFRLIGKRAFTGWPEDELRRRIAAHRVGNA